LLDPRFLAFVGAWLGLNLIVGLGSLPIAEQGQEIAWQAHIGGFLAGFFLFDAFDPISRRGEMDAKRGS
jgi:membrane associated rhomboid family serine protease